MPGHDTQECGVAGAGRNDSDNGVFSVGFCLQRPQCPAGPDSCDNAVIFVHLCVCLLQRGSVLLRVPQSKNGNISATGSVFGASLSGNEAAVTNVNAAVNAALLGGCLPGAYPQLATANTFTANQTIAGNGLNVVLGRGLQSAHVGSP
jgi:hypothetical protein